jgi:ATP-dependent Lon protease
MQTFSDLPQELPIFPLGGSVVLPGVQLPLNIFEPRYLSMVSAALASDRLIGMVQPIGEADVTGRPDVQRVGCAGRITSYSETNDGRIILVLTGLCRFEAMAVTLTDSAANHVSSMLAKRGHGLGLRIGTKKSGCTGFAYVVDYADDLVRRRSRLREPRRQGRRRIRAA